jgi:hypothetical protein
MEDRMATPTADESVQNVQAALNNLPTAAEMVDSVIREARAVLQERLSRDVTLTGEPG